MLLTSLGLETAAQIAPHDFTQKSESFSQILEPTTQKPIASDRNTCILPRWHKKSHRLTRRRAPLPAKASSPRPIKRSFKKYPKRSANLEKRQSFPLSRKFSLSPKRLYYFKTSAKEFPTKLPSVRKSRPASDWGSSLSLRDINRYQFRRNRSDQNELPVQSIGAP